MNTAPLELLSAARGAAGTGELGTRLRRLTAVLPPGPGPLINLCDDRGHFTAAFLAAVQRGQLTLLPHNRSAAALEDVLGAYPGARVIDDASVARALASPLSTPADEGFDASAPAAVLFSSGSTGRPSANTRSWASLVAGGRALLERLTMLLDQPPGAILGTVPPQHMYGLETTVLLPLLAGERAHPGRPLLPADVHAALEELPAPRGLVTTPLHLRALVDAGLKWPPLQFVLSATAPLDPALARRAEAELGTRALEIFGSTETGALATRRPAEQAEWRLLGGTRLRPANGEVWAEADHLPAPQRLGDQLEVIDDRRFRVLGRHADMLKVGGKRASLADLNSRLLGIPGVLDGVIVMPPERSGRVTRPLAVVVAPGLDPSALRRALAAAIDPVFLPRPVYHVDALPRTAAGKLPRDQILALIEHLERRPCD